MYLLFAGRLGIYIKHYSIDYTIQGATHGSPIRLTHFLGGHCRKPSAATG